MEGKPIGLLLRIQEAIESTIAISKALASLLDLPSHWLYDQIHDKEDRQLYPLRPYFLRGCQEQTNDAAFEV
jgi:hypothetical protein